VSCPGGDQRGYRTDSPNEKRAGRAHLEIFQEMASRLFNAVAVITGASAGIGRASSVLFAKQGANVVCADVDAKGLKDTVEMVNNACGRKAAVGELVDVSKAEDCKRMVARAESEFGRLTVLFNNAGIMMNDGEFHHHPFAFCACQKCNCKRKLGIARRQFGFFVVSRWRRTWPVLV